MSITIKRNAEKLITDKKFELIKAQKDFKVKETTGTTEITYTINGKVQRFFFIRNVYANDNPVGRNLCRIVKQDVQKYLSRGNPTPDYLREDMITMRPDEELLDKLAIGDVLHEIDVNSCYWALAYQLGYISAKTFREYMHYKEERLMALGNLAKITEEQDYVKGKKYRTGYRRFKSDTAAFFFSIICKTYHICQEVNKSIGYKMYYFKTDAFWVPPSIHVERKVHEVLTKHGLAYKVNRYKVKSIHYDKIVVVNLDDKSEKIISLLRY